MDTLILGFQQLQSMWLLIALLSGAVLGVILGAIPGLGPAVGIAILLPATFQMEALNGLTLLLGVYCGSWYGGAIPAILINTPGTAVNALTTYDGYPMTQQGKARSALAIAYTSSFFGGIISVFALMFLAPWLAKLTENFGSVEFAMAALLGMVMVVVAHRGQMLLAMGLLGFGFFLSTVGLETIFNTQRYTFDNAFLLGGVPLIPAVLGLFAISQAFVLLQSRRKTITGGMEHFTGKSTDGIKKVLKHPKTVFCSSGFGILMGVIPGVGEFLAQFFSYTLARRMSKTPEKFGKGASEGLIASETSNNAVPAAALVPLLALGIPGEALTAMMLSVFMVHSVIPGPALFVDRPDFISGLYASLLVMNVFILLLLFVSTRWIAYVTTVRNRILGMMVLVLSFIGVYTSNYNIIDCFIALAFGIMGYALKQNNMPIIPIILGLVLGPIFENRLRQALSTQKGDLSIFIDRPIAGSILIFIVLIIVVNIIQYMRTHKNM